MFQQAIKQIVHDRAFLVVLVILFLLAVGYVVSIAFQIAPSDLQLPVRYSAFGLTNFYRDKWYYLIGFAALGLVILVAHLLIAMRLYIHKSRQLAVAFMWLGVAFIVTSYFTAFALFKVVSLSQ
ncbi:MAG TPA: hypothetical protein VD907_05230 [Verrucomicrobiae bacterium]|nr:hypothetical protein [Verrucomicrobiae bacterium]